MILIGLTGGIGSGKSTVAKMFENLGVPIYNADVEAKRIMEDQPEVVNKLRKAFGDATYINGSLNRKYLADVVFNSKEKLKTINSIVHPAVGHDFIEWANKQETPFVIQESALIFENNKQNKFDSIINVIASLDDRIERVKKRDGLSEKKIKERMQHQLSDEDISNKSDFTVINDKLEHTKHQVSIIFSELHQLYGK